MGKRSLVVVGLLTLVVLLPNTKVRAAADTNEQQIAKLNQAFIDAILKMDNSGVMALWADDGVDLLPGLAPIVGKSTIAKWLDDVTSKMKDYRVIKQEVEYHDLKVCGDWASEWGSTHQVVQPPEGKPPIEIFGKMALVLHKEKDGSWRITQEMWNASPK